MLWHILRYLTISVIPVFYKRIQGKNIHLAQAKGPMIIAMNHPNAFTDPIIFTYVAYPVRVQYLARGDAFKPGITAWFLEQLGIVPIFRIQDGGKEGLKKNDEAYRRVNRLLKKNGKVIVFAEGLCVQERRLRPLKKGVARMVFGAYEFLNNDELKVLPVGVNYSKPDKFRSNLFYNIGEPILVKDFIKSYRENPARAYNQFLELLEPRMKELITHIDDPKNDEIVMRAEILIKRAWLKEQQLDYRNLEHDFEITKQITERVNVAEKRHPELLHLFEEKAEKYFAELKKFGLRDWLLDPVQNGKAGPGYLCLRTFLILLGLPFSIVGLLGNYLPYKGTEMITKWILKGKQEFYSSVAIGIGLVLLLLNYILWFAIIYLFSPSIIKPVIVCVGFILGGWFNLYFYFYVRKTVGIFKAVTQGQAMDRLRSVRAELISLINKF